MRTASLLLLAAATSIAFAASASCSSDTPAGTVDSGVADADDDPLDFCSQFTKVGDPCTTASPVLCFADCDGGCRCAATANGPEWTCTTDTSCHPDAAPVDLDANLVPDAPADDAGDDAGVTGDAASDAATE